MGFHYIKPGYKDENCEYVGLRDAHHVPTIVVKSNEHIVRGSFVGFTNSELTEVLPIDFYGDDFKSNQLIHGIADPFFPEQEIYPGVGFHVFLLPDTIKNLVHHFDVKINNLATEEDSANYDSSCKNC